MPVPPAPKEGDAQETVPTSSTTLPATTPPKDVVVSRLKESLVVASQFEAHLRELTTQAEVMKENMQVSTYVSISPTGCCFRNTELEPFGILDNFCRYLIVPVGALLSAPTRCIPQSSE